MVDSENKINQSTNSSENTSSKFVTDLSLVQSGTIEYIDQEIENMSFDFYQVAEITFIGNNLINVSISVMEATKVRIINNTFSDPQDITIVIWHTDDVLIESNSFKNVPESAIQIYESDSPIVRSNIVTLTESNDNSFALFIGIKIDRCETATLDNNDVYSPLGDGIYLLQTPNSILHNNTIRDTGFTGIAVLSSANTTISENKIIESSQYALYYSGNIPQSSAMSISDSDDVMIKDNRIDYSDYNGVELTQSNNVVVDNNIIINHAETGISLGMSENVQIINNGFYNNGRNIDSHQSPGLIQENNIEFSTSPVEETVSHPKNSHQTDDNFLSINFWILISSFALICGIKSRRT